MEWAAIIIPSLAALGAAAISLLNRRRIKEVHVLVNNRLDAALEKIGNLEASEPVGLNSGGGVRHFGLRPGRIEYGGYIEVWIAFWSSHAPFSQPRTLASCSGCR